VSVNGPEKLSVAVPLLAIVTCCEPDTVFTVTDPNDREAGASDTPGAAAADTCSNALAAEAFDTAVVPTLAVTDPAPMVFV
jgi:hypothetical protein